MAAFWKVIAAVLVAAVLGIHIGNREKEFHLLLTMTVCVMGAAVAIHFLEPVLSLLHQLEEAVPFQDGLLDILLKCSGLALVSELACLICQDSGSGSLGKMVQLLGNAAILYLSMPMITTFLELIREILGDL